MLDHELRGNFFFLHSSWSFFNLLDIVNIVSLLETVQLYETKGGEMMDRAVFVKMAAPIEKILPQMLGFF